jgi:signal peptidase I
MQDRVWYAAWYFVIPAALAVALVQSLALLHVIDDAAPWQYLLAFAVLEVVVLGVRDRVMGARGLGVMDLRTITSEARELQKELERLSKKANPKGAAKSALADASAAIDEALAAKDAPRAAKAVRALDVAMEQHLSSVRKGTTREYVEAIGVAVLVALGVRAFVVEAFKIPSPSMYPTLSVGDNIFVNKFIYGPLVPYSQRRLFQGARVARGEVVVFVYPQDPAKDFIKRVIGLPGDRVLVGEDGSVVVNGRALARCEVGPWRGDDGEGITRGEVPPRRLFRETHGAFSYLTLLSHDPAERESSMAEHCVGREANAPRGTPCTVPPDMVFVMGDNRDNSYDSRYWGFVPMRNIKGRAMHIWWSSLPGAGFNLRWDRFGQSILGEPPVPPDLASGMRACQLRGR